MKRIDDNRAKRQSRLVRLLADRSFGKQEEIVQALRREGFDATQSSVSRDFRDLGVVKVAGRYVRMRDVGRSFAVSEARGNLVTAVDTAGPNLIIVKTPIGAANVVALSLDARDLPGLVGTVAGDDTVFIATRNRAAQGRIIEALTGAE
jgi:transcriptional regulator of arginine metabolism